ncbi:MAG: four helix bundle protein [Gemmatimonadaceae bacterium]
MHNTNKLHVLDNCLRLCARTYELTGVFPPSERCGLTDQMRRASVSIGSNIAEGGGRFTNAQFVQSLSVAHGSASELDFQARVAVELSFMAARTPPTCAIRSRRPNE